MRISDWSSDVCSSDLLILKSFAAWQTGSVAMLGSLADTGLDLLASLVTLYGVRIAAMPADYDHRFGHGKAEALAALFQVRSGERRGGKECVSTCRIRLSAYP